MTTIRDVAKQAGVSISTVSRVVNQSTPVDPVTSARVREAIAALGYRPNLLARSFRRRVTHTIGLVVPDNSNPFFAELARVIEDEGFAAGYSVILEANVPCVAIDRDLGDMTVDQVLVDNEQGGALAADYLYGLGHRRFAYVAGPSDLTPSAGRIAGFRRRLERIGAEVAVVRALPGNGRHDGGVQAARSLVDLGLDVTAAFVFNDLTAIGMIGALHRCGCRVPADLSIIGFDDIPQAGTGIPALTTIAQPVFEMGKASVRLLLDRIARRDAPHQRLVFPTELIERESCRPLFEPAPEGTQSMPAGSPETLSAMAVADHR
jgi:LacI family transcriptional regulator